MTDRIAFIGAGRWALSLALGFLKQGARPALWETDSAKLEKLLETRGHPDLPDGTVIPDQITVSGNLESVLAQARLVIFATPSDVLADAAGCCAPVLSKATEAVLTATKGIGPVTLKRMSVLLKELLPGWPVVVLAGPAIPYDFALGDPTSLVAASEAETAARMVRDSLTAGNLRGYSSNDVGGVELGAALKNVIALAAGIADGLGLGLNAKSALLVRGLAEITRLGIAMNANPLTFSGLSGMGDLIVTAFSNHSRNHCLGMLIGKGKTLTQAQADLNGVVEGVTTARSARSLASRHRIEMPITEEVCRILFQGSSPQGSLKRLLGRTPKKEAC